MVPPMKILFIVPSKSLNNVSKSSFKVLIDNICLVQRGFEPVFWLTTKGSVQDLYAELYIRFNLGSAQRYFGLDRCKLYLLSIYQIIQNAKYSNRPSYIILKD